MKKAFLLLMTFSSSLSVFPIDILSGVHNFQPHLYDVDNSRLLHAQREAMQTMYMREQEDHRQAQTQLCALLDVVNNLLMENLDEQYKSDLENLKFRLEFSCAAGGTKELVDKITQELQKCRDNYIQRQKVAKQDVRIDSTITNALRKVMEDYSQDTSINYYGTDSTKIDKYQLVSLAIREHMYTIAMDNLREIEMECGLSDIGFLTMSAHFLLMGDTKMALEYCSKWKSSDISLKTVDTYYFILSKAYFLDKKYAECIRVCETALLDPNYNNKSDSYLDCAHCYAQLNNILLSYEYANKFVASRLNTLNIIEKNVLDNHIEDNDLGWAYMVIAAYKESIGDETKYEALKLSAACGYNDAIDICQKLGLLY